MTKNFNVLSIGINCDYKKAFDYLADQKNLSIWTNQFKKVDGNRASFDTFNGVLDVEVETFASEVHGTIDWKLTFPDGNSGWAYSRLTRNVEGVIYAFNFVVPPMPAEELTKAVEGQTKNIEDEISKLKKVLEN